MRVRPQLLGIALFCGCASRSTPATTPVLAMEPSETTADAPPPDAPAEDYAGLVRQVAARETAPAGTAQCLVERVGSLLRYGAFAAAAIRPLPFPSPDLDDLLARSASVNVLTQRGRYGSAAGALTLAAYSAAPPLREAVALILTDTGVALRGVEASGPRADRLTRDAALEAVLALQPASVFVAAEAAVATPRLAELLEALQTRHVPVALAVDLPRDAALTFEQSSAFAACPDGLPATDQPEGELALAQIKPSLATLSAHGADCLGNADARGAAGGRVRVMLRVGPAGSVTQACISADETHDPKLLACILAAARSLRFPAPSPPGNVDLELPLALTPAPATPLVPVMCDGAPVARPIEP
jgi:hypothetical protein